MKYIIEGFLAIFSFGRSVNFENKQDKCFAEDWNQLCNDGKKSRGEL